MADKSTFTPEEWKLLLESVMMAGIAITAAEPSGLWGLLKESIASSRVLMEARSDAASNPLVKAIVADFETSEGRTAARDGLQEKLKGAKPQDMKARCIETLGQAGALVDAKAPSDAAAFKSWLQQISKRVSEAASEGGFMGFGGLAESEAEKATLAEISTALRVG